MVIFYILFGHIKKNSNFARFFGELAILSIETNIFNNKSMDLGDELDFWHSKDIKGRLLVAGG